MINKLENLDIDQVVKISNEIYIVNSYIIYNSDDSSKFIEYELVNEKIIKNTLHLSIGITENYTTLFKTSSKKSDNSLLKKGYKLIENQKCHVTNFYRADVGLHEEAIFIEYEHEESGHIYSIEKWEDEIIYTESVHFDDIEILTNYDFKRVKKVLNNNHDSDYDDDDSGFKISSPFFIFIIISIISMAFIGNKNSTYTLISDFLLSKDKYIYYTSITSDVDSNLYADIYTSEESVGNAAKDIISNIDTRVDITQASEDDLNVTILTDSEYVIIYPGSDMKTYIQVSSREYTCISNNGLYENYYESSETYYHDFYYSFGYTNDSTIYDNHVSPYMLYAGNLIYSDPDDPYMFLNSSIKRSSTSTRPSSGGGTSYGK